MPGIHVGESALLRVDASVEQGRVKIVGAEIANQSIQLRGDLRRSGGIALGEAAQRGLERGHDDCGWHIVPGNFTDGDGQRVAGQRCEVEEVTAHHVTGFAFTVVVDALHRSESRGEEAVLHLARGLELAPCPFRLENSCRKIQGQPLVLQQCANMRGGFGEKVEVGGGVTAKTSFRPQRQHTRSSAVHQQTANGAWRRFILDGLRTDDLLAADQKIPSAARAGGWFRMRAKSGHGK